MNLCPITLKHARRFVDRFHRHNKPPQGGLFAVAAEVDSKIIGVAIVGRPIARNLADLWTCEITRCCTDGSPNACSMLYGACARAAKALGWRRIITYTLATESGASLRAAGFIRDREVPAEQSWSRPSRPRIQTNLFGQAERPACDKVRWVRILSAPRLCASAVQTGGAA